MASWAIINKDEVGCPGSRFISAEPHRYLFLSGSTPSRPALSALSFSNDRQDVLKIQALLCQSTVSWRSIVERRQLHPFLMWALDGCEWSASLFDRFTAGKHPSLTQLGRSLSGRQIRFGHRRRDKYLSLPGIELQFSQLRVMNPSPEISRTVWHSVDAKVVLGVYDTVGGCR